MSRYAPRILPESVPQVAVSEPADSSVNFVVRPRVKNSDYWSVKLDLTRKIKEAFDENDIEIPFPQQVVHVVSGNGEKDSQIYVLSFRKGESIYGFWYVIKVADTKNRHQ